MARARDGEHIGNGGKYTGNDSEHTEIHDDESIYGIYHFSIQN